MRRGTGLAAVVALVMMFGASRTMRAQDGGQPQQDQGQNQGQNQGQGQMGEHRGRGAFAGMQHVEGEITAVSAPDLTVKTEDGATMQIVTTDNTRVMKGRGVMVKVADLKVGDGVMAAGNLDAPNKTLHAAFLFATDAAQLKAMRENLGKTYIVGKVTAIDMDNAKMTVERPDHVEQTIGFDETTSFRRGGRGRMGRSGDEGAAPMPGGSPQGGSPQGGSPQGGSPQDEQSITLADIKVGDTVRGRGSIKGGVFVPTELVVRTPGQGGRRHGGEGSMGADANPAPQPQ